MYFLHNFYSKSAWDSWLRDGRVGESDRIATSKVSPQDWRQMVQFDAVNTFDELVQRVAFLQLMNKRQVLYFRGEDKLYPTSLPSIFRGAGELEELQRRWRVLKAQSVVWRKLFVEGVHPRQRTLAHYPQALWAIQQHYKDHLRLHGVDAAATPLIDLTHSLRVAAHFATSRVTSTEHAYVIVIGLPQTTGSITFNADEQVQILRLSALCPPKALLPSLQEAYLVGRFPMPDPESGDWNQDYWDGRAEYFSLRRRTVAIIPIRRSNGSFEDFWKGRGFHDADLSNDPWFESVREQLCLGIQNGAHGGGELARAG